MALAQNLIVVLALVLFHSQCTVSQQNIPISILRRNDMTCPHNEDRERARNELSNYVQNHLDSVPIPILPINQSCGGSTGWTRIAYLNMSDPAEKCPSPWAEFTRGDKRVCFRHSSTVASCDSVVYYNYPRSEYNKVCGHIIGYQYGNTNGFAPYNNQRYPIDSYYIDGISVTHGQSPRQHIWTFAAGYTEFKDGYPGSCPCGSLTPAAIPPYIGNNYFCETGTNETRATFYHLYSNDPLWDGEGCGPDHNCECTLHSPPWFTANLTTPTTDDIEVRSCCYRGTDGRNVGIELIELYIK